jgi:AraC-like DNA-binding protein
MAAAIVLRSSNFRGWWGIEDGTANWHLSVQIGAAEQERLEESASILREGMSSSRVASKLGFSSTRSFRDAFVKRFNLTPIAWAVENKRKTLYRQRIRVAEELLVFSKLRLKEVAKSAGFAHQAHMTRAFRKVHGETPTSWKAKNQR